MGDASVAGEGRGRYLSKDIGSVIVGPKERSGDESTNEPANVGIGGSNLQGEDADRMLQDLRFVIGDYVDCAVFPPLPDGSVAPVSSRVNATSSSALGGGMRAFGGGPLSRDGGFGRQRGGYGGAGRGGNLPSGEWRRGERIPEGSRGGYNRINRGRGRPY